MKIKKILILLFLIVSYSQTFAQSKRVADRYFNEFAYVRAAKLYESLYQKGDSSSYILKRLGDSYYNNAETKKAEYWYDKLIKNKDSVPSDYLFKFAQVLRSNGKYQKSDSLLIAITPDSDIASKKEELADQTYLLNFSNIENKRISIRNLALNTPYSDFGGFMLNDKETFFASASPKTSKKEKLYKWNNQPFLNIYTSNSSIIPLEDNENKDSVLILTSKKLLPAPVNTKYHESTPVFTKGGKIMYFTRVNYDGKKLRKDKKQTINLKLYKTELIENEWSNIEELPFNSNEYSVGHPALSPDEKTLYFVSDMPGGIGKTDIYKVAITDEGYGEPINLGTTVNTPGKEMFPFIGHDNTLYFSSNGHVGFGLLDIFQTKIKENTTFDKPLNLGAPFNSKKDDFSFYIDEKGRKGFLSSNREKGKGDDDIYSFIIYEEEPEPEPEPEICTQIIAGTVRSSHDNSPIPNATVKLLDTRGVLIAEALSTENGNYTFDQIPCVSERYTLNGTKLDYKPDTKSATTGTEKGTVTKQDLVLTPLIIGNQIVISPIYFDFNKSTIREDAQYELENIVIVMNNHPNMVIKIESHTDSRGGKEYNRKLSDRRAKSTRNFIISRGIGADRIESAVGYGEARLLNDCDDANRKKCTEEEHQLNRRSYFYIVSGADDVDIENKKPVIIDKSLLLHKQKLQKEKFLLERLNNFRRSRSNKKASDKCKKDTDCN